MYVHIKHHCCEFVKSNADVYAALFMQRLIPFVATVWLWSTTKAPLLQRANISKY